MSRTRAERRHNTRVKAARRNRLSSDYWGICGGKVTKSGEACTCTLCEAGRWINDSYLQSFLTKVDESWWLAQA